MVGRIGHQLDPWAGLDGQVTRGTGLAVDRPDAVARPQGRRVVRVIGAARRPEPGTQLVIDLQLIARQVAGQLAVVPGHQVSGRCSAHLDGVVPGCDRRVDQLVVQHERGPVDRHRGVESGRHRHGPGFGRTRDRDQADRVVRARVHDLGLSGQRGRGVLVIGQLGRHHPRVRDDRVQRGRGPVGQHDRGRTHQVGRNDPERGPVGQQADRRRVQGLDPGEVLRVRGDANRDPAVPLLRVHGPVGQAQADDRLLGVGRVERPGQPVARQRGR